MCVCVCVCVCVCWEVRRGKGGGRGRKRREETTRDDDDDDNVSVQVRSSEIERVFFSFSYPDPIEDNHKYKNSREGHRQQANPVETFECVHHRGDGDIHCTEHVPRNHFERVSLKEAFADPMRDEHWAVVMSCAQLQLSLLLIKY